MYCRIGPCTQTAILFNSARYPNEAAFLAQHMHHRSSIPAASSSREESWHHAAEPPWKHLWSVPYPSLTDPSYDREEAVREELEKICSLEHTANTLRNSCHRDVLELPFDALWTTMPNSFMLRHLCFERKSELAQLIKKFSKEWGTHLVTSRENVWVVRFAINNILSRSSSRPKFRHEKKKTTPYSHKIPTV